MKWISSTLRSVPSFLAGLSPTKKVIVSIFVFLLILLTVLLAKGIRKEHYNTQKVGRSDIVETVDESGLVKISGRTDIYSPTIGIIEQIFVRNGDIVSPGQELFKVMSTASDQEKQAAYANYLTAKNTLDAALSTKYVLQAEMFEKWDVFRNLATNDTYEDDGGNPKYENRSLPEFHISEKEWLASEAKYKNQEQVIAQARSLTSSAWALYQATQTSTVTATANGTIANTSVVVGDTVKIATLAPKPIMTIADFSVVGVLVPLGESDISKVNPGDPTEVTIPPLRNKKFKGEVMRVDDIGNDIRGVVKYDVYIQIENPDKEIKSGMSADVLITTRRVTNVLSVPNTAIKPYKEGKAVQVVNKQNKLELIPVQLGVRGEKMTEVVGGLAEGQEIVVTLTNEQTKRSGLMGL